MGNFVPSLIRIIFFIIVIRSFVKKSMKKKNINLTPENQESIITNQDATKIDKKRDLTSSKQKSTAKVLREKLEKKLEEKEEIKPLNEFSSSLEEEISYRSSAERFRIANSKLKETAISENHLDDLIDKNNLKRDILKGIIFKEILSEPRCKNPYQHRK